MLKVEQRIDGGQLKLRDEVGKSRALTSGAMGAAAACGARSFAQLCTNALSCAPTLGRCPLCAHRSR